MASELDFWKDLREKWCNGKVNEVRAKGRCPGKDWMICESLTPKKFWAHQPLERNRVLCMEGF